MAKVKERGFVGRGIAAVRSRLLGGTGVAVPDQWLVEALGGAHESESGVRVTEDVFLSNAAMWSAIRQISEAIGMLPFLLYERHDAPGLTGRRKERAEGHPLYRVLHDYPNEYQTSIEFRSMMQANILVRGNAFAEIERDLDGNVKNLWWIHPRYVEVKAVDGVLTYVVNVNGARVPVLPRNMLHLRGFTVNGLLGINIVKQFRNQIGLSRALESFLEAFFSRGTAPGGVLTHPEALTPDARKRLEREFQKAYGNGLTNAQRILILDEGVQWAQRGTSPEDSEALDSRRFAVSEVSRITGMPLHMLGDLTNAHFSNIVEQSVEFVTYCLGPWCTRWEQRSDLVLLSPEDRASGRFFTKFNTDALLRGDPTKRWDSLCRQVNNGIMTQDEARDINDMNPLPEGTGAQTWMPVNMMPVRKTLGIDVAPTNAGTGVDGESDTTVGASSP